MGDAKKLNYLKDNKVKTETRLYQYREQAKTLTNQIKAGQVRLKNLQTTYQQLKDAGADDKLKEITEGIQTLQAGLVKQGKDGRLLDEWIYTTNQELVQLNTQIAKEDSSFNLFESNKKKPKKKDEQEDETETPKEETESAEAKQDEDKSINQSQQQAPSQQQKKLSAKDIKKQLKANLIAGQPKKNLTLIRQSGNISKQPQVSQPIISPVNNSPKSAPTTSTSQTQQAQDQSQKRPIWKKVLNYGKQQAQNAAFDAYDTAARPVVRTAKTITKPYYVTRDVLKTTSTIVSATKEHGAKKVLAFGAKEAGTVAKNQALKGAAQVLSPAINLANNIKNVINNIKNIVKAIRILTTSATLVGAVANIALLFKNKLKKLLQTIAKIYAAIQALLLLMWLWLLAKIAGIIAGALFGAVTGLPILLIPGAGPFLYAGWVGFWAYKGWTDPLGTIHLATHPWEAITRPLNWIGDQFSGFGAGAKGGVDAVAGGIGNVTSGTLSAAGNFVTGLASSAWGGITGAVGSIASSTASFAGSFFSSLASAGSAIVGNVIPVAVGGAMATVVGGTVMATVITNSAFYTQDLDIKEDFSPPNQNEIFTVTKTVDQPTVGNLGATVNFTVTIRAIKTITAITITDTLTNGSNTTNPTINCTVPLTAGNTCTQTFPYDTGAAANAIITNSVNVNATADDGTTSSSTASATVTIGSAPQTCQNFQFISGTGSGGASWTQSEIDTVNSICNTLLARSPSFMTFLSTTPTITLARYTGTCSGGVNGGTVISFFGCNLSSFDSAKYVVVHELGHVIGNINLSLYNSYTSSGAYQTEGMIKTYPLCPGNINEGFAEMIADYVVAKTYNFPARCTGYPGGPYTTFQTNYPMHYSFARDNIFGGVEY